MFSRVRARRAVVILWLLLLAPVAAAQQQAAERYTILFSNDDGYDAPGLQALIQAFQGYGDLYVSAPARNQSGKGHSITIADAIVVQRRATEGEAGEPLQAHERHRRRRESGATPAAAAPAPSQYAASRTHLAIRPDVTFSTPHRSERVIVPVPGLNRPVVHAGNVGRTISEDIRAVYITDDAEEAGHLRRQWELQVPGVPLVIVESPYRALVGPLLAYLDVLNRSWPPDKDAPITLVIVPEYVARHWWERILYNQSARRLRSALLGRPLTVVVDVPYRREEPGDFGPRTLAEEP